MTHQIIYQKKQISKEKANHLPQRPIINEKKKQ